jgi:hypothetical protein
MASPIEAELTFDSSGGADTTGACREFWMKFPGLSAASDCDTASVIYYKENPFCEDLVVLASLAVITTLDGQDGDIDVGFADDSAGTASLSHTNVLIDSLVNSAAAVLYTGSPQALAATTTAYIWKAKGSSTDSYLSIIQNADADVSALRWTLLLKVIPYKDLINSNITLTALSVA